MENFTEFYARPYIIPVKIERSVKQGPHLETHNLLGRPRQPGIEPLRLTGTEIVNYVG